MAQTQKPKVPKPLAKRDAAKPKTQKEQSERFIKTALELGCDETGESFSRAIEKILPSRSIRRDIT